MLRTIPAPVGGWNARDPLAEMKPLDAVTLTNFWPRVADVVLRNGCADHVTGVAGNVESLMSYNGPSGSSKMFAVAGGNFYNVSVAGAVGASVAVCTNDRWQSVQMGTSAGHYLMCANGVDNMKYFDGTNWITITGVSVPAITNVATGAIINLCVYNRRLYLIESGKLNFWYLPADAAGGAATEFLLGPVSTRGGYTMAAASWSFDGGDGVDDYIAFATSEGEVIVYRGTNPSDPTAWSKVGVYFLGKPIGRRCFMKYGGDLILLTQNGAFPLSKALQSSTVDYKLALSNKIEQAFNSAAQTYFNNWGWEGILYPAVGAMVFNIPTTEAQVAQQYVMNTVTKAWCNFTGWNANCFAEFARELYFGTNGKVVKAWTGRSDYGNNIDAYAKTAYNYFGSPEHKVFQHLRPQLLVDGGIDYSVGLSVDFKQETALSPASFSSIAGAQWDVSLWDQSYWAGSLEIVPDWRTAPCNPGGCAAMLLAISTNMLEVQWAANDYWYELLATPLT